MGILICKKKQKLECTEENPLLVNCLVEKKLNNWSFEISIDLKKLEKIDILEDLLDMYFFTFSKKMRQGCYFFLISTENNFIQKYENVFFFKNQIESFYLNTLTSEIFKYLEECINTCKEVFQILQRKLIFKLKDFHIYINSKSMKDDCKKISVNLEKLFSVLHIYNTKIEMICLKFVFTIDIDSGNLFLRSLVFKILKMIFIETNKFKGFHLVLHFNKGFFNFNDNYNEIKKFVKITFLDTFSLKISNPSYINCVFDNNSIYKLMKSRDCLSFYSFLYATHSLKLRKLRNKRAILLNTQKHFMSSTLEIIDK